MATSTGFPDYTDLFTEKVEDIFCSAMEIEDDAARRAFIEKACSGDADLRAKVETFFTAHEIAKNLFTETSAALVVIKDACETLAADPTVRQSVGLPSNLEDQLGRQIGPYRLVEVLGQGGCGVVYMAEQQSPVCRQVALKIIKLGMDTKSVIARFDAERQMLAMMDHPNIAHVLDAGATDTGRPYFVMELVRGTKITSYCDQHQIDVTQRLKLFIQICQALQHAHQKGIIHRDIKPSNILVALHDGVPMPMMIDFGIAKAVEGRLTDETMFTPAEQFIGTPAYMSPEQAQRSRLDVDTRSDIYSLGVLLFELLTGKTPFEAKKLLDSGVEEMRRMLREQEPQRPSALFGTLLDEDQAHTAKHRCTDPARLGSLLCGDLDWIVMKALEKDRNRRYQTANGLAADIQRYLDNEPVSARPPSRIYRLQKLVQRNQVLFASGAAVALALAAGLGIAIFLLIREHELLQRAVAAEHEQARLRVAAERGREVETQLRQQAEWREGMRQATAFIYQKNYSAADQVVAQLPSDPPTMEGAETMRTLAEWNALHGKWAVAEARYQSLLRADRFDNWDNASLDLMAAAVSIVKSGDREGYQRFCREIISSTVGTANPMVADRVIKSSLLLPPPGGSIESLRPLTSMEEAQTELKNYATAKGDESWRCQTMALWKYREGRYQDAMTWAGRCLAGGEQPLSRSTAAHLIRAMALYKLQEKDEARPEFARARDAIRSRLATPLYSRESEGGFWFDWVISDILLNEATLLIENSSKQP